MIDVQLYFFNHCCNRVPLHFCFVDYSVNFLPVNLVSNGRLNDFDSMIHLKTYIVLVNNKKQEYSCYLILCKHQVKSCIIILLVKFEINIYCLSVLRNLPAYFLLCSYSSFNQLELMSTLEYFSCFV